MENFGQDFIILLQKYPLGERMIVHSGKIILTMYCGWIAMVIIALIGEARGQKFRETRTRAGLFLLTLAAVILSYFIYRLYTKYR